MKELLDTFYSDGAIDIGGIIILGTFVIGFVLWSVFDILKHFYNVWRSNLPSGDEERTFKTTVLKPLGALTESVLAYLIVFAIIWFILRTVGAMLGHVVLHLAEHLL